MTSTTYDEYMIKQAEHLTAFRAALRDALGEALAPDDVEWAAVAAEAEFGAHRCLQLGEEVARGSDQGWNQRRLLRLCQHDWLSPVKRRTEDACFFGRMRRVEVALHAQCA